MTSPDDTPKPRGGRRPGSGKPAAYGEAQVQTTVRLPRAHLEALAELGRGRVCDGIRALVEEHLIPGHAKPANE
jgi:hypothetical protein